MAESIYLRKGLSGWLILLGISIVFTPIRNIKEFYLIYIPFFKNGIWEQITDKNSENYIQGVKNLIFIEISVATFFTISSLIIAFLFFYKHRLFPKIYIIIGLAYIIYIPFSSWLSTTVMPEATVFNQDTKIVFIRALIGGVIWFPYLLISERSKLTFVETFKHKRDS